MVTDDTDDDDNDDDSDGADGLKILLRSRHHDHDITATEPRATKRNEENPCQHPSKCVPVAQYSHHKARVGSRTVGGRAFYPAPAYMPTWSKTSARSNAPVYLGEMRMLTPLSGRRMGAYYGRSDIEARQTIEAVAVVVGLSVANGLPCVDGNTSALNSNRDGLRPQ